MNMTATDFVTLFKLEGTLSLIKMFGPITYPAMRDEYSQERNLCKTIINHDNIYDKDLVRVAKELYNEFQKLDKLHGYQ